MKKIYVLVVNNPNSVGYNCENVYLFDNKEDASARMKELYEAFCRNHRIDNPYEENSYDVGYQEGSYEFVFGEYYLDIFEKNIGLRFS